MNYSPLRNIDIMHLYIDFKCPAAYLALHPTLALSEQLGVPISWHPIRKYESPLLPEKPEEEVSTRHRRVRAVARQKTHQLYAGVQNLPLQFRNPPTDTDMALAALCLLTERGDNPLLFVRAAFAAYWTGDTDLNDAREVIALLGAPAIAEDDRNGDGARTRLEAALRKAEENGIFTSPTYVVEDAVSEQVFVGREHLPWIRELLKSAK